MTVHTKLLALIVWLRSQADKAAVATALRSIGALEASQLADRIQNACSSELAGLLDAAFSLLLDAKRIAGLRTLQAKRNKLAKENTLRLRRARRLAEHCLSAALSSGYDLSLGTAGLSLCSMADESEVVDADAAAAGDANAANLGTAAWLGKHRVERLAAGRGLGRVERNVRSLAIAIESGWATAAELDGLRRLLWRQLHQVEPKLDTSCELSIEAVDWEVGTSGWKLEAFRHEPPAYRSITRGTQLVLPYPVARGELFAPTELPAAGLPDYGKDGWAGRYPEMFPELYPADAECRGRPGTPNRTLRDRPAAPYRQPRMPAPTARLPRWTDIVDSLNQLCGTAPGLLAVMATEERNELQRWVRRGLRDAAFETAVRGAHHFLRRETARMGRWGNMEGRKVIQPSKPLGKLVPVLRGGLWCSRKKCERHAQYQTPAPSNRLYCQHHAEQLVARSK